MILRLLQRFRRGSEVVHECRNCGTTVDTDETPCPTCESEEIAQYRIGDD